MSILVAEERGSSSILRLKHRRCYVNRDCEVAHLRLLHDYFDDDSVYPLSYFHRRYRIRRTLFLSIMHKLSETSPYFTKMDDATGLIGLTPLKKCTVVVHQLAMA
jgi:hypothetical protein